MAADPLWRKAEAVAASQAPAGLPAVTTSTEALAMAAEWWGRLAVVSKTVDATEGNHFKIFEIGIATLPPPPHPLSPLPRTAASYAG